MSCNIPNSKKNPQVYNETIKKWINKQTTEERKEERLSFMLEPFAFYTVTVIIILDSNKSHQWMLKTLGNIC